MAQQRYRANLSAAQFPFSQTFMGQSVILGRNDQNFNREVDSNADADKDRGIPQIFYCHNVLPTGQGFQSVGFNQRIAPLAGASDFDQVFNLRDSSDNRFLFAPAAGKNYIWDSANFAWVAHPFPAGSGVTAKTLVTVAYIRGTTYICYANYGVFTYNTTTKTLDTVTLLGITITNVIGICAAQGYLLVWDKTTVSWSNLTNELDFVPSLTTGAGGGNVYDTRANIILCLAINNGFMVYTKQNCVGASYSGNTTFPFVFKEVAGSGGIDSINVVSHDDNTGIHYAYTDIGFQQLNKGDAKQSFPEVTDFLAGLIFEDFDTTTYTFTTTTLSSALKVAITVCGNRYVVLSYGVGLPYTHALVYDTTFKRWGKLKITHVDVVDFVTPNLYGEISYTQLLALGTLYSDLYDTAYTELLTGSWNQPIQPKHTIGFLSSDGTIQTANMEITQSGNSGCIILGKYQHVRDNWIQLQGLEVENIPSGATDFGVRLLPSLDGKNFATPVNPTAISNSGLYRRYGCFTTAKNISLAFTGTFYLASLELWYNPAGQF